ncbi:MULTISPECIES: hypothetical protein [unclassified Luteococcus]|uniref:hypothetical protein n=1 Tax=unclassified Luteococcus TaxID=2639923 RepID=UPI00313B5113
MADITVTWRPDGTAATWAQTMDAAQSPAAAVHVTGDGIDISAPVTYAVNGTITAGVDDCWVNIFEHAAVAEVTVAATVVLWGDIPDMPETAVMTWTKNGGPVVAYYDTVLGAWQMPTEPYSTYGWETLKAFLDSFPPDAGTWRAIDTATGKQIAGVPFS